MPSDGGDPHPEWLKHRLDGVKKDLVKMRQAAESFREIAEESARNGHTDDAVMWFEMAELQEKSALDEARKQAAVG